MEFVKSLTRSEAKYKYVGLPKKIREEFPDKDKIFKLKFRNKLYDMKVNNKDCIMLSQLYHVYEFQEGNTIKIISSDNENFELSLV